MAWSEFPPDQDPVFHHRLPLVPASVQLCSFHEPIPTPNTRYLIRPQAQHAALQAARQWQRSETFQQRYALRAGIEATISQEVRAFDLRRSRYVGLPKTHLQHLAIATVINLVRLVDRLDGNPVSADTIASRF